MNIKFLKSFVSLFLTIFSSAPASLVEIQPKQGFSLVKFLAIEPGEEYVSVKGLGRGSVFENNLITEPTFGRPLYELRDNEVVINRYSSKQSNNIPLVLPFDTICGVDERKDFTKNTCDRRLDSMREQCEHLKECSSGSCSILHRQRTIFEQTILDTLVVVSNSITVVFFGSGNARAEYHLLNKIHQKFPHAAVKAHFVDPLYNDLNERKGVQAIANLTDWYNNANTNDYEKFNLRIFVHTSSEEYSAYLEKEPCPYDQKIDLLVSEDSLMAHELKDESEEGKERLESFKKLTTFLNDGAVFGLLTGGGNYIDDQQENHLYAYSFFGSKGNEEETVIIDELIKHIYHPVNGVVTYDSDVQDDVLLQKLQLFFGQGIDQILLISDDIAPHVSKKEIVRKDDDLKEEKKFPIWLKIGASAIVIGIASYCFRTKIFATFAHFNKQETRMTNKAYRDTQWQ